MSMPRKIRCVVESVVHHGGRVYTVDLEPASPVPVFHPGQFLHLTVDDFDPASFWPESRVFSMASSPRDRSRIRICYSVKGRYTTRMEQALQAGREVWVKLPYGDFVIGEADEAVLLAGGTGISAFTAFLEGLNPESRQQVTLVYGARTPGLLLFREMILARLASVPNLSVIFFTEETDPGFDRQMAALAKAPACFTGRISLDLLWPRLAGAASQVYYLSGPPPMLQTLAVELKTRGVPPAQIRTDAWE